MDTKDEPMDANAAEPLSAMTLRELIAGLDRKAQPRAFHAQLADNLKKTTKNGNPYREVRFADAEEQLVLRVWDNHPMFEACAKLEAGAFFEVSGVFGLGHDGRSVDAKSWSARDLNTEEIAEVLAGSPQLRAKQAEDYAEIERLADSLGDPRLRDLCRAFLEQYGERLRRTAAARNYHHARRGGLVEHVAQMMRTASKVCEVYAMLNRDLLIAGALFHDIGKLWENHYEENGFEMRYTEVSELISHIPLGMEIVNKLWRELLEDEGRRGEWAAIKTPSSNQVRLHLLHLVASHHGEIAFGSPVVPKTPEAQALHYIDNLDAKMEMFERGYQVAATLDGGVREQVRPLPGRLVVALKPFGGSGEDAGRKAEPLEAGVPDKHDPSEASPTHAPVGPLAPGADGHDPGPPVFGPSDQAETPENARPSIEGLEDPF